MTEPTIGELAEFVKEHGPQMVDGYLVTYVGEFKAAPDQVEPSGIEVGAN